MRTLSLKKLSKVDGSVGSPVLSYQMLVAGLSHHGGPGNAAKADLWDLEFLTGFNRTMIGCTLESVKNSLYNAPKGLAPQNQFYNYSYARNNFIGIIKSKKMVENTNNLQDSK